MSTDIQKRHSLSAGREIDYLVHTLVMGYADVYYRPYSTDMNSALSVLRKLADMGHVIHLKADGLRPRERRFTVIGPAGRLTADMEHPELAICIAALQLV